MEQKTGHPKTHEGKGRTFSVMIISFVILAAGVGIGTAIAAPETGPEDGDYSGQNNIATAGMVSAGIDPNELEVYLGVESHAETARESQQEAAETINDIRAALISGGIAADDISTSSYNIYPVRDYTDWQRTEKITGYRTIHILKIESGNVNIAGNIIDTAVDNGANKVNSVLFTIDDETLNQIKTGLLADAASNAKQKAESIAGALGVQITGVLKATEGYNYMPYRYTTDYAMLAKAEAGGIENPTQITPGDIQVSASVTVEFGIA